MYYLLFRRDIKMTEFEMEPDFANYVYVSTLDKMGFKLTKKNTSCNLDNSFFDNIDPIRFVESKVGHGKEEVLDKNIRSSKIIKNIDVQIKSLYEWCSNNLNPKRIKPISHSLECNFSYNIDLIKYEKGDHFNEFHYDTFKKDNIATVLIFPPYNTIMGGTGFQGGGLIFKLGEKTFTLNTSTFSEKDYTIVIFSDILHKCEPITSGIRYVFKTTISSEMPKILSDDMKFKLDQIETHKFNIDEKENKRKNQEKIAKLELDLEKAIDTYFDFKKQCIKENLPDDLDDFDNQTYDIRDKLSEYKTNYKRIKQQITSLQSINNNDTIYDTIYDKKYDNEYKIKDDLHNICVLPDYIENNINDINNYDEYSAKYIMKMIQKGYNVVPLYMKFEFKTDYEEGWRQMHGSSPINIDLYDDYPVYYNLQYEERWILNGKQLDYHSEYNDQSGDDIYEEYECSCLLIWK